MRFRPQYTDMAAMSGGAMRGGARSAWAEMLPALPPNTHHTRGRSTVV